ncbi:MAG TPA: agmatinase [Ignavibacteriales bacterium]|nr:agmatinase [Ignavibacteriales bacterium]HOL80797.1 agmatinase [Ignavibacteriales bacterium]HOM66188.1 agmatinase [Ignavibacteriales bacterium]HPP33233.1 agmatinase [Ignavibacteriales bacterium]HRR17909.1 agmatinase [Ignavibacteriales bacterium]
MKYLSEKDNFLALEEKYSNYDFSKFVIVSAPFEKTVSYGHGTAAGPQAIIEASQYVEFYDDYLNYEAAFEDGIITLEPLEFSEIDTFEESFEKISNIVKEVLNDNKIPVVLGGEHSISSAVYKPFHQKYENISVLHFDAHSDLRDEYSGTKFSHACVMKRIFEMNSDITQIGIRAQCREEAELIKKHNIKTYYMQKIRNNIYGTNWVEEIVDNLKENVFLSFDVDAFDPSVISATGTPEPGGLFWDETLSILEKVIKNKNIVGFDVVELAPVQENTISDFNTAKLIYKIISMISYYSKK